MTGLIHSKDAGRRAPGGAARRLAAWCLALAAAALLLACPAPAGPDPIPEPEPTTLPAVVGLTPASGATVDAAAPALAWSQLTDAASYEVQIAASADALASAAAIAAPAASYSIPADLAPNSVRFWRVRGLDAQGVPGAWSAAASFTVAWSAVGGLLPASGAVSFSRTPALAWTTCPGAAGYDVQIVAAAAEPSFEGVAVVAVASAAYTPAANLANGSTYYWRVRARDATGVYAWSRTRSFAVSTGQAGAPTPAASTPVDTGATPPTTADTTPTLTWTAVAGAAGYQMRYADSAAALLNASAFAVPASGFTPDGALVNGSTYYWEVRAVDAFNVAGPWSPTYVLKVSWSTSGPADGIRYLSELVLLTGAAYRSGNYVLTADIDVSSVTNWTPLGYSGGAFAGSFDGQGHTISGLKLDATTSTRGFFATIAAGATVKNLALTGVVMTADTNENDIGALAGLNYGSVENCSATGSLTTNGIPYNFGGLIGRCESGSVVKSCSAAMNVTGYQVVGGLVGSNAGGTIEGCSASGAVVGNYAGGVGGLVGYSNGGVIRDCRTSGTVNGGSAPVGGLLGVGSGTIAISASYATGAVSGTGNAAAGGLVGSLPSTGTISRCYATGSVTVGTPSYAYPDPYAGGLVGSLLGAVSDSYARGAVTAAGAYGAGGLVGQSNGGGTIARCFSTGAVANGNANTSYTGGLVGNKSGVTAEKVANAFYDMGTSGQIDNAAGSGIGLGTGSMKAQASFTAWDFAGESANGTADIWSIDPNQNINDGYPYLTALPPQ